MKKIIGQPRLAIYDFTDCEGCQMELIALKEKLLVLEKRVEIAAWRLGQEKKEEGILDLAIIEGAPVAKKEVVLLKQIRKKAKYLLALGSCATLAGIPAILDKKQRLKWCRKIYGSKYKPVSVDALPLSAYVPVDFLLHGCPINRLEFLRVIEDFLAGKKPAYRGYSVCLDCKTAENPCRLLDKKPCLGPITQGGCQAVCVSGGSACYGCFGIREQANIKALLMILDKMASKAEIKRNFKMFLSRVISNR